MEGGKAELWAWRSLHQAVVELGGPGWAGAGAEAGGARQSTFHSKTTASLQSHQPGWAKRGQTAWFGANVGNPQSL